MRFLSSALRAQIVKELLSVWRDPRVRLILVVPPILQLFVFSFAATLEIRRVDLAVHDRDGGKWSHELLARFASASFVRDVHTVQSPEQLRDLIDRRIAIAGIEIPEDFSRDVEAGREAVAQVIVDGRRSNGGQVALGYMSAIAQSVSAEVSVAPVGESAAVRHWFNPNLTYRWFVVPSLPAILVGLISLLLTALSIAREREMGTFDQLLVSPTTPFEIIVAKIVPALCVGTALLTVMVGVAVFGFRIPFTGSFLMLLGSAIFYVLSIVGIGLMISSICVTQQQAILGTFAVGVPLILISGFATPVDNMPLVLRWLAQADPIKHFLIIIQGTFLKAMPASDILANLWPIAVIAVVTLSAATVVVRRNLQ